MTGPALLLFPGAGTGSDHPSLRAIEAASPWPTVRADFAYRKAGRRSPDRPAVLIQAVVDEAERIASPFLVLGGRSMGGRICSIAVAQGLVAAAGLVLISYPLHPPGKRDQLRVEHFGAIDVPCLFVSGTRDAFGSREELETHTAAIAGPVTHEWLEGLGHDLKGADARVASIVVDWLTSLAPPRRRGPRG
jgi:uncharacterized protein